MAAAGNVIPAGTLSRQDHRQAMMPGLKRCVDRSVDMGVLIHLPERPIREPASRARAAVTVAGVAEILFFTGVRYVRETGVDSPVTGGTAPNGPASDAPRTRRRRG
jgi:hypothetical protein